jgi:hypothetical protein
VQWHASLLEARRANRQLFKVFAWRRKATREDEKNLKGNPDANRRRKTEVTRQSCSGTMRWS